jgi:hypothetical protein
MIEIAIIVDILPYSFHSHISSGRGQVVVNLDLCVALLFGECPRHYDARALAP